MKYWRKVENWNAWERWKHFWDKKRKVSCEKSLWAGCSKFCAGFRHKETIEWCRYLLTVCIEADILKRSKSFTPSELNWQKSFWKLTSVTAKLKWLVLLSCFEKTVTDSVAKQHKKNENLCVLAYLNPKPSLHFCLNAYDSFFSIELCVYQPKGITNLCIHIIFFWIVFN